MGYQETLRNLSSMPGAIPGLKVIAREAINLDTDAAQSLIVETGLAYIHFAVGYKWVTADGTLPLVVYGTEAASTTYDGTRKVTFAIPALSTLHFLIVGSTEIDGTDDLPDNGGNVTIVAFDAP